MRREARSGREIRPSVFEDQYCRALALRCLYETLRNTAVWIYAVHEYQETRETPGRKPGAAALLDDMIGREIENSRDFIRLWAQAPVEWMAVSGFGETPFIYGENFAELLKKKIRLMTKYRNDVPAHRPGLYVPRRERPITADTGASGASESRLVISAIPRPANSGVCPGRANPGCRRKRGRTARVWILDQKLIFI